MIVKFFLLFALITITIASSKDVKVNSTEPEQIFKKLELEKLDMIVAAVRLLAAAEFPAIDDPTMGKRIIEKLPDTLSDNELLINLINILPTEKQKLQAYLEIVRRDKLGYLPLTIQYNLNQLQIPAGQHEDYIENIQHELLYLVETAVQKIVAEISENAPENWTPLLEYVRMHPKAFSGNIRDIVEEIFIGSENKVDAIHRILTFGDQLYHVEGKVSILTVLNELIQQNYEQEFEPILLQIAQCVKCMLSEDCQLAKGQEKALKEIAATFSAEILKKVWGKEIAIDEFSNPEKTNKNDGDVFTDDDFDSDSEEQDVQDSRQKNLAAQEELFRNVTNLINGKNFTEAEKLFQLLEDKPKVFAVANNISVENLVKFTIGLPIIERNIVGYEAIVSREDDLGYWTFSVDHFFRKYFASRWTNKQTADIQDKLKTRLANILNTIADEIIKSGDLTELLAYAKENPYSFEDQIPALTELVYKKTNGSGYPKMMEFVTKTQSLHYEIFMTDKLHQLYKETNETSLKALLAIAFRVKLIMSAPDFQHINQRQRDMTLSLKEKLPSIVKNIVWGKVCLKNRKAYQYLHKSLMLNLYLENPVVLGSKCDQWEFNNYVYKTGTLAILHSASQKFLYAERKTLGYNSVRPAFLWRGKSSYYNHWQLEMINWEGNLLSIRHKRFNEYLAVQSKCLVSTEKITEAKLPLMAQWEILDSD